MTIAQSYVRMAQWGFKYKLNNGACAIIPYQQWRWNTLWQIYVTSKLKIKFYFCFLFCFVLFFFCCTRHGINFHSCEKQMLKSSGSTKIRNDSKWTKTSRNEIMWPTTSNNYSWPIFPYHLHNQAGVGNPFINTKGFIYLGISKMSFNFLHELKVAYQ